MLKVLLVLTRTIDWKFFFVWKILLLTCCNDSSFSEEDSDSTEEHEEEEDPDSDSEAEHSSLSDSELDSWSIASSLGRLLSTWGMRTGGPWSQASAMEDSGVSGGSLMENKLSPGMLCPVSLMASMSRVEVKLEDESQLKEDPNSLEWSLSDLWSWPGPGPGLCDLSIGPTDVDVVHQPLPCHGSMVPASKQQILASITCCWPSLLETHQ